jgi:hypothetical protein
MAVAVAAMYSIHILTVPTPFNILTLQMWVNVWYMIYSISCGTNSRYQIMRDMDDHGSTWNKDK